MVAFFQSFEKTGHRDVPGADMAFKVGFIIWPNQQKVLGLVEDFADAKAAAARLAGMTSRINTMLSIPMLYCMVAQQNAGL
jgi:uncharacterized membrane protein